MILVKYRRKRDFLKTPEPEGKTSEVKKEPLFVIHEHWATHHHFDFRLEIEGVLKSWAIPKNLPQKVGEKRLAVQVEDHPLEYTTFKGKIPRGQYGAGKVEVWDWGKFKIEEKTPNSISFDLFGEKIKGRFLLFKPPKFEKKNWLLMLTSENI